VFRSIIKRKDGFEDFHILVVYLINNIELGGVKWLIKEGPEVVKKILVQVRLVYQKEALE
jgi:hypothetical protein